VYIILKHVKVLLKKSEKCKCMLLFVYMSFADFLKEDTVFSFFKES